MDLTITRHLAIGNGILTVENSEQAWERANRDKKDKQDGACGAGNGGFKSKNAGKRQGQQTMSDDMLEPNPAIRENSLDKKRMRPVILRMRTGARIAAVQLAYSVGITKAGLAEAMPEFIRHYDTIAAQLNVKKIDDQHFQYLASGIDLI